MTDRSGDGEVDLPVFDAVETIDTVARQPGPRSRLGPGRGAGIAAAILVVIVGGIVIGSLPRESPSTSAAPSGLGPVAVVAAGSDGPCAEPSTSTYPTLSMAVSGVPYTVQALYASSYRGTDGSGVQSPWSVPPLSSALYVLPQDRIEIAPDLGACFQSLHVTAARTALAPGAGPIGGLFEEIFRPPAHAITFDGIQAGDWVLRAEARFASLDGDPATELVTISYFRVIAGGVAEVTDVPNGAPDAPIATPTVACGFGPARPDLTLRLEGGRPGAVDGVADTSTTPGIPQPVIPVVEVGLGDSLQLVVAGDLCAVSWDIEFFDTGGQPGNSAGFAANPSEDPGIAAQNRWTIAPTGDQLLVARLHFAGGMDIARTWHVIVQPFTTPAAFLIADGTRFQAPANCGLEIALHNGYTSSDSCGGLGFPTDSPPFRVRAFKPVTFEIPGWSIRAWSASCGNVTNDTFVAADGCSLGGGSSDAGAPLATAPAFLLAPRDTIVLFRADAVQANGDQFSVDYLARVIAR
ncbi:MAG: hypothetical protein HY264_07130 [Chloroflexi bacterium]|nr:hypothetical protein [Chloroflexota bacterium]